MAAFLGHVCVVQRRKRHATRLRPPADLRQADITIQSAMQGPAKIVPLGAVTHRKAPASGCLSVSMFLLKVDLSGKLKEATFVVGATVGTHATLGADHLGVAGAVVGCIQLRFLDVKVMVVGYVEGLCPEF